MSSQLQVFVWGELSHVHDGKQYYRDFQLNGTQYALGDAVCLFPESEGTPCYVGRLVKAFCDLHPSAAEPHCIEIRWFERIVNLDPRQRGLPDKEKELVELEETDINPIGCISCKCLVFRARDYEEAVKLAKGTSGVWFFSRGQYRSDTATLVPYADLPTGQHHEPKTKGRLCSALPEEDVADSEDTRGIKKARMDSIRLNNGMEGCSAPEVERTTHRKKSNNNNSAYTQAAQAYSSAAQPQRCCVECGATQTPQWREGPQGPKTLCNACGVRYGRQQNRAGKRCGGAGVSRTQQGGRAATTQQQPAASGAQHKYNSANNATSGMKQDGRMQERNADSQQGARPMRQAAMLAANRTAEFARTGAFPELGESKVPSISPLPPGITLPATLPAAGDSGPQPVSSGSRGRRPVTPLLPPASALMAGLSHAAGVDVKLEGMAVDAERLLFSHESSHNSTESAQDVVVSPSTRLDEVNTMPPSAMPGRMARQHEMEAHTQVGSGDLTSTDMDENMMLLNSSSNLLMHGMDGLGLATGMSAAKPGTTVTQPLAHLDTKLSGAHASSSSLHGLLGPSVDLKAVAARATMWVPSMSRYLGVLACIDEARCSLPPAIVENLDLLGRAADKAAAEAAAADAALAAVHQVLLTRQQEAAKARSEAVDVIGRLRGMVADLVDKHPQLAQQGGLQHCPGATVGTMGDLDDVVLSPTPRNRPPGGTYDDVLGSMRAVDQVPGVHGSQDLDDVLGSGTRW